VLLRRGERGFARYAKMEAGTHTLILQAANSDGIWGRPVAVLQMEVDAPLHKKWQTYLAGALMVSVGLWLFAKQRIRRARYEASLKTRAAENRLAALTSQMNPHFVFNCLQTANGLIANGDNKGAMKYVTQFAKLMRTTLENSRVNFISLEDEVRLLELYLTLEQKRLERPFRFEVTVADDLDPQDVQIPPMLLQPFVENAIKHGVFHRTDRKGEILVSFGKEGGSLVCTVRDNGVGRKFSAEKKEKENRQHVSRGLEIVNERLQVMRQHTPGNYGVKTEDLYEASGETAGTLVRVWLPLDRESM
jgi:sensor histidine kinase YesM